MRERARNVVARLSVWLYFANLAVVFTGLMWFGYTSTFRSVRGLLWSMWSKSWMVCPTSRSEDGGSTTTEATAGGGLDQTTEVAA